MISQEEFKERLDWTLDQKIDHSLYVIEGALAHAGGNVYVSFSGGKDSTVLLSLAKLLKPNIRVVFFKITDLKG